MLVFSHGIERVFVPKEMVSGSKTNYQQAISPTMDRAPFAPLRCIPLRTTQPTPAEFLSSASFACFIPFVLSWFKRHAPANSPVYRAGTHTTSAPPRRAQWLATSARSLAPSWEG